MKDPDKQEVGILGLVLISIIAGILVGFWLFYTHSVAGGASGVSTTEATQP